MRARDLLDLVSRAGGTVSAAELITAGARWEDLYRARDAGTLLELSRGIYRLADAPPTANVDLVAVCRRVPHGVICLNSAASFWELSDELPDTVHIGIARGRHRPIIRYPPTSVHVFAAGTFDLGRIQQTVETGEAIHISSRERTVVDMMRMRSRVGRDQALTALRRYLESSDAHPGELLLLAQRLRAGRAVAEAIEPLMA